MEGTYTFLPPECCSFDSNAYSMKMADIWALGITIYILTFNKFPFSIGQTTEIGLMENICNFTLNFEGRDISPDLRHLLEIMLQKDPTKRASLQDLKSCRFINQGSETIFGTQVKKLEESKLQGEEMNQE
jgi:serine/threonine protein kinase